VDDIKLKSYIEIISILYCFMGWGTEELPLMSAPDIYLNTQQEKKQPFFHDCTGRIRKGNGI
jgi:hypothetical protein